MISKDGGAAVTARGVCWGTLQVRLFQGHIHLMIMGPEVLQAIWRGWLQILFIMWGLCNQQGCTAYGMRLHYYKSYCNPTVTTLQFLQLLWHSGFGWNITSDGNGAITAGGVCWATTASPTTDNLKPLTRPAPVVYKQPYCITPGTKYMYGHMLPIVLALLMEMSFPLLQIRWWVLQQCSSNTRKCQVTVTFLAPLSDGGSAITGYTVTSNPVVLSELVPQAR